jgi:hypothetical protein
MMTRKLFLVLSLLVLLSMALLGVTYSAWSEEMLITGAVATGTLDAVMLKDSAEFNGDNAGVGACTSALSTGQHTLTVSVGNSYDGFTCHIPIEVQNPETIPVKVSPPQLTWDDASHPAITVALDDCWTGTVQLAEGATTATAKPNCKVSVHVGAGFVQGASYDFHYDFTATQFNY